MSEKPKIEPPVPEKAPRAVGFLLSQLGFATSKRFLETLEPIGIHPREFLLLRFLAASDGHSGYRPAEWSPSSTASSRPASLSAGPIRQTGASAPCT